MTSIGGELQGEVPGVPPAAEAVNEDIPCRKCAYNLRSMRTDGRCPECGTSVWVSLQGTLLRYSDPNWVETIRRGFARMIAGITIVVAAMILAIILSAMRLFNVVSLVQLVGIAGWLIYMWGIWLITEPDPSGLGEDQYGTSRKIIRVGVVCQAVGQVLEFVQEDRMPPGAALLLTIVAVLLGIVGLVAIYAQLQYLQKLALRIPDLKLSQRSGFLKLAIVISYGTLIVSGLGVVLLGGGVGSVVFGLGAALGGLALLVFALMYLRLLGRMKKSFQEQVLVARATWGAAATAA